MNTSDSIDWDKLDDQFITLKQILEPFILPTDAELREYRSALAQGNSQRAMLGLALDWGARTPPAPRIELPTP